MFPQTIQTADHAQINQVYVTHAQIIDVAVRAFTNRHGGHYPTMRTDADVFFLLTGQKYGFDAPDFATRLRRWVWSGLMDQYRKECNRQRLVPMRDMTGYDTPGEHDEPGDGPYDQLTPDAQLVVDITIDPPAQLVANAEARGGKPQNFRSCLREWLMAEYGWTNGRVSKTFTQLAEVF